MTIDQAHAEAAPTEQASAPVESGKPQVYLFDQINGVVIGGKKHGWLVWRHPDGQWVTVQKAEIQDPMECVPDVLKPIPAAPASEQEG